VAQLGEEVQARALIESAIEPEDAVAGAVVEGRVLVDLVAGEFEGARAGPGGAILEFAASMPISSITSAGGRDLRRSG